MSYDFFNISLLEFVNLTCALQSAQLRSAHPTPSFIVVRICLPCFTLPPSLIFQYINGSRSEGS
jgi:hypothetical protein